MYLFANSIFNTFLSANGTVYMVRAFTSEKQYVSLSTYGGVVPMLIVAVFNIIFPSLMGTLATSQAGWIKLVAIFAVPMTVLGMLRFFVVKETRDIDAKSDHQKVELRDILEVLKKNPYIYILSLASLVMNIITNMGVNVFYFTDIVGNVGLMGVLAATQFIILPLMFIFPQILKKISVMKLIRIGILCAIVGFTINFFAGSNLVLLIIGNLLTGAGAVPISMLAAWSSSNAPTTTNISASVVWKALWAQWTALQRKSAPALARDCWAFSSVLPDMTATWLCSLPLPLRW